MKRKLLLSIVLILISLPCYARMSCLHWGGGSAGSLECTEDETHTVDDQQWVFGRYSTQAVYGFDVPSLTGTNMCQIIFQMIEAVGDIEFTGYGGGAKKYYVTAYTLSGNDLSAEVSGCRSDPVDGDAWAQTDVTWSNFSNCNLSSADVIVIYMDDDNNPDDFDIDGSNAAAIRYENDTGSPVLNRYFWGTTGTYDSGDTDDETYRKISTLQ